MGLLMTIDAPLMFCWVATLYCVWRMLDRNDWKWVAAATLCCGLGLLSKQTMIALIALVWLFVAVSPADRGQFRRPALWLWTVGSMLFLAPFVIWNSQHDWVTFQHTSEHFHSQAVPWTRQLVRFVEYCVSQFGVISPLVLMFVLFPLFGARAALKTTDRRLLFLGVLSVLPLVGVLGLSLTQRVQPNWPAPFYPAGFILIAAWAFGEVPIVPRLDRLRKYFRPAIAWSGSCAVVVYLMPFLLPAFGLNGSVIDVTARLQGWSELGLRASSVIENLNADSTPTLVAVSGRNCVSPLAFYTTGKPHVYRWNSSKHIECQHDLWEQPDFGASENLIVLSHAGSALPQALVQPERTVELCETVTITLGKNRQRRYDIWHISSQQQPIPKQIATQPSDKQRL